MEAWREVARRIAHEIKNPLTPIQLSAERLRRQLGARPGIESALVEECTKTIIGEVEDLKRLVNEFSAFARMPHLNPVPGDINALAERDRREIPRSESERRVRARARSRDSAHPDRSRRDEARAGQPARQRRRRRHHHHAQRRRPANRGAQSPAFRQLAGDARSRRQRPRHRSAPAHRASSSRTIRAKKAAPDSASRLFPPSSPTITASSA